MNVDKSFNGGGNGHVQLILDWLNRAATNKERHREENEKKSTLSWGTIQQLNKTTWLLGCFQVILIILFATLGGTQVTITLTLVLTLTVTQPLH
jgi:hypothetical protein